LRQNALIQLGIMGGCLTVWMFGFIGSAISLVRRLEAGTFAGDGVRVLAALVYIAGAIFLYRLLIQRMERRQAVELARGLAVVHGLSGFAIGTSLFFFTVGLMWLAGCVRPTGFGGATHLIAAAAVYIMPAVGEEILFRGVVYRIVERAMGTSVALLVSALLFGLAHLVNPDFTLFSALIVAIGGLMLGLAYAATRNLWFPIGIHFAWNFTQGGIFGASGGLVKLAFSGPHWITGGSLGLDNSAIALALCIALALAFALLARNRGRWEPVRLRLRLD